MLRVTADTNILVSGINFRRGKPFELLELARTGKISLAISDAILDACLEQDPYSRVACETLTATGLVVIAGEITTRAYVDFQALVRGVVTAIGYDNAVYGFDSNTCAVISTINKQSGDIAMGVDTGGAGDQGMMFGYANSLGVMTTLRRRVSGLRPLPRK